MNEIDHFKKIVLCSGDVTADVDHLHVKRIHLVGFSYIVIEDYNDINCNILLQYNLVPVLHITNS
jgi:hypothetical protein